MPIPTASGQFESIQFYKNGVAYAQGTQELTSGGGGAVAVNMSALVSLNATDYIEVYYFTTAASVMNVGSSPYNDWVSGHLVSAT
jgi:hypothetical protein